MLRPWMLMVAILVVTGCKSSGSTGAGTDPFLGRTRVEPPRTGAVRGQLPSTSNVSQAPIAGSAVPGSVQGQPGSIAGSAFAPASNAGAASPNAPLSGSPAQAGGTPGWTPAQTKPSPVPAAISPQTNGQYVPPDGSFGYPSSSNTSSIAASSGTGDRLSIPVAARTMGATGTDWATRPGAESLPAAPSTAGQAPSASAGIANPSPGFTYGNSGGGGAPDSYLSSNPAGTLAGRERIVREIQPSAGGTSSMPRFSSDPVPASGGATTGAPLPPAADKPINITDLPEARS